MAGTWLLLLLALECPALPTGHISLPASPEATSLLRLAQRGVGGTPFPSLAPPITLLVNGKQQMLVVCLVLDVAPPGLESPIWFSTGNGSALDAFTYGPSPAADGTWTSLAQLSLPSEELASWETLVCHTGAGARGQSQSTEPLLLSGEISSARTCLWEPLRGVPCEASLLAWTTGQPGPLSTSVRASDPSPIPGPQLRSTGMPGQALRLGALRLLLFKLLLFDLLLTCRHLRTPPAALGHSAGETRLLDPGISAPAPGPQPRPLAEPGAPSNWSRCNERGITGQGQPRAGHAVHTHPPILRPDSSRSSGWEEGALSIHPAWARCSGPAPTILAVSDLPPPAARSFLGARLPPPSTKALLREKAACLPSDWEPLEGGDKPKPWDLKCR